MHPALWKLLRLRYRANLRRTLSGLKSVRGAITFCCGAMMLVLMLGSNVFVLLSTPHEPQTELLRTMVPVFLLGFTLLSLNSSAKLQAIHFWPAEVDFLFAGPFARRELLYYKIAGNVVGAVFLSLLFSTWTTRYSVSWWFVIAGLFLAICFVQLLQIAFVLVAQTLSEHGVSLSRKLILLAVGVVLAIAVWNGLEARQGDRPQDYVNAVRQTTAGIVLLAPFDIYGRVIAAEHVFPDFVLWAGVAAAINAALVLLIVRLDANYLESSVAGSQAVYQRMQRMRSGNFKFTASEGSVRRRLPQFPRLGGVGTIARRQFTKAIRSSMWVPLIMIFAGGGVVLFLVHKMEGENLVGVLVGASVYCTFIFSSLFPFDFRGDLEQMELLKQLPLRPIAIAAGELAAPIILVTLLQLVLFVVVAVITGNVLVAGLAGVFVVPLNVLLYGVENVTFLIYPVRIAASTPGDFQHFGRQMMMMMAKMLFLAVIVGFATGGGVAAYVLLGKSTAAGLIVAWCLLMLGVACILPLVAWAFQRFDVSRSLAS